MYAFATLREWPDKEKLNKEKELAGFYLSAHPLQSYGPMLKWIEHKDFADHLKSLEGHTGQREPVAVACGLLQSHRVITTKKGDKMAFAQLEDLSGQCEVIIFPKTYKRIEHWLGEHNVFLIKGSVDLASRSKCKIKADIMVPLEVLLTESDVVEGLHLQLPGAVNAELLAAISEKLLPGSIPVKVQFEENGKRLQVGLKKKATCSVEGLHELGKLGIGITCVI